jgi:hypothetical protein
LAKVAVWPALMVWDAEPATTIEKSGPMTVSGAETGVAGEQGDVRHIALAIVWRQSYLPRGFCIAPRARRFVLPIGDRAAALPSASSVDRHQPVLLRGGTVTGLFGRCRTKGFENFLVGAADVPAGRS